MRSSPTIPRDLGKSVFISRMDGVIAIRGHAWPNVPPTETRDPDFLKSKLRDLYPQSDVTYDLRRMYFVAKDLAGPVELREAACWRTFSSDLTPETRRTIGEPDDFPCVDARTGENISDIKISWRVEVIDENVKRTVFRVGSSH